MPPSINPGTVGNTSYSVSSSKGVVADLRVPMDASAPFAAFQLRWPAAAAGTTVTLARGGASATLPVVDGGTVNDTTSVPTRRIVAAVVAVGSDLVLDCEIRPTSAPVAAESWTVRAGSIAPHDWQVVQNDNRPMDPTITRLMCDPVAGFTITAATFSGGTVREKDTVTLTAVPPVGSPAAPTVIPFPDNVTVFPPTVSYRWTKTGPAVPITAFPACSPSATMVFACPGVYGARTVLLAEEVWFEAGCGGPPGFLASTSAAVALTIEPRPQHLALVLDRSGSMAGSRWENAKTAAQILGNLFTAMRAGVHPADRTEHVVFEDPTGGWHPGPHPIIGAVLGLTDLSSAQAAVCSTAYGAPGSMTPIGDGLIRAMDDLASLGVADDPRFTIVLCTDGRENCGSVVVDANAPVPPGITRFSTARQSGLARAAVNNRLALYTIGLGSFVQEDVLDQLAVQSAGVYRHVLDVDQLGEALAQMVSMSQGTETVEPEPPVVGDTGRLVRVDPGVSRLALAVEWAASSHSLELSWRALGAPSFAPLAVAVQHCPSHGFAAVDVAGQLFGGDETAVPATEWRIVHRDAAGVAVPIPDSDLLVFVDLMLRVDVVFDQERYVTGQPMLITARLRFGDEPITRATVRVELARPGESLGTFLARGGGRFRPSRPQGSDPQDRKGQMLAELLRRAELEELPVLRPASFFADGTDQLLDDGAHGDGAADDGDYANRYRLTDQEGTYTWRFHVSGHLPDGSPFSRVLTLSRWVGVRVDPRASRVDVSVLQSGNEQLVQVTVYPQDRRRQMLGPFRPDDVMIRSSSCAFREDDSAETPEGVVYPTTDGGTMISRYDGGYQRTLSCRPGTVGQVTITVQGRAFPPVRFGPRGRGLLAQLAAPGALARELARRLGDALPDRRSGGPGPR